MKIEPAKIYLPPKMLDEMLAKASACAVALLLAGTDQFTVRGGDLSEEGFDQLRRALQKYWPASTQHDLNRFIGLTLDEGFYYLFAKFLPQSDYLLSLVFAPQTPWVRIRQDMTDVMRRVLQMIQSQMQKYASLEQSLQFVLKPYPVPHPGKNSSMKPGGIEIEDRNQKAKDQPVPEQRFPQPPNQSSGWQTLPGAAFQDGPLASRDAVDSASRQEWIPLADLFEGGRTPSSNLGSCSEGREPASSTWRPVPGDRSSGIPEDWQPLDEAPQPESDLVGLFHEDFDLHKNPSTSEDQSLSVKSPPAREAEFESDFSEEATRPHIVDEEDAFDQIKLSDITFYLVPRQARHYLLGELAQRLRDWLPGICKIYGWQLDFLSVRPDYIKWRLHDFPDALIHEMLEVVRKRTSERIFRVFPNLREGNPVDDFWSPGYLVDRENQDFSTQVLIAHLEPTRRHD